MTTHGSRPLPAQVDCFRIATRSRGFVRRSHHRDALRIMLFGESRMCTLSGGMNFALLLQPRWPVRNNVDRRRSLYPLAPGGETTTISADRSGVSDVVQVRRSGEKHNREE